jgi:cyclic pyranopterin phosphate synthase
MIVDTFHRAHDYLRISITDNCNLRCFYCMPDEEYVFTPASRLMQVDEIAELARQFTDLGVKKIRLTGGEPLVRKDAAEILRSLSRLPVELTMTTNATRLHLFTDVLREAGMRSVNVSLDTLQKDRFQLITRRDQFQTVMDNISLLIGMGIQVKVNAVIMRGMNDGEINDFVGWTRDMAVDVRFIEFMPFEGNRWTSNRVFTWQEILNVVDTRFDYIRLEDEPNGTAKSYRVPGHAGTFSVISTMSAPFCGTCNRMRLTADGKMKNCLFSGEEMDLLGALRKGEDVSSLIRTSVLNKKEKLGGQFTKTFEMLEAGDLKNRSMITIGG